MTTQQRNQREKLIAFKRIIYGMIIEIYQTCSNIAKTKVKIQMLKLLMPYIYIYIIRELEDLEPRSY